MVVLTNVSPFPESEFEQNNKHTIGLHDEILSNFTVLQRGLFFDYYIGANDAIVQFNIVFNNNTIKENAVVEFDTRTKSAIASNDRFLNGAPIANDNIISEQ